MLDRVLRSHLARGVLGSRNVCIWSLLLFALETLPLPPLAPSRQPSHALADLVVGSHPSSFQGEHLCSHPISFTCLQLINRL